MDTMLSTYAEHAVHVECTLVYIYCTTAFKW